MTTFTDAALSLSLVFALVQFFILYKKYETQLFLWYALGSFFYLITSLGWFLTEFNVISDNVIENVNPFGWTRVAGVSVLLVALGIENWLDRPQLLRFPYIFTMLPLLLILSFGFVFETTYLNEIILGIYEGGALLVAILLFGFFMSKNGNYGLLMIGIATLLLGYIVYWFPGDMVINSIWIWKLIILIGVGICVFGYTKVVSSGQKKGNDATEPVVEQ